MVLRDDNINQIMLVFKTTIKIATEEDLVKIPL